MLPRDISQQIFNELVYSQRLTEISLQAFRDCALQVTSSMNLVFRIITTVVLLLVLDHIDLLRFLWQDLYLGEYPEVNDKWMDVIASQGSSLLCVDLSGSDVTDSGLIHLKDCTNLQSLNFNYCDRISDHGLEQISGTFSYLSSYTHQ